MLIACAGCEKPILDKFLLNVLERTWHVDCVRCFDCHAMLNDKCFTREGKLFCRTDFFRRYGTKCGGCGQGISPSDLVRKARDKVFHLNCFTCLVCRKQLSTGEELYVLDDNKFICKSDYEAGNKHQQPAAAQQQPSQQLAHHHQQQQPQQQPQQHHHHPHHHHHHHQTASAADSGSEEEEDDDNSTGSSVLKHHPLHGGALPPLGAETNNNSLNHADLGASLGHFQDSKTGQEDSEDQNSLDGDAEARDAQAENKSPDDSGAGAKRRGPRTTIKAKQLEILKTAFSQTPKPTRHIREQLAKETGLAMRVIQVWFQNKRSKERRLKQLTSMGRGPFFGSTRKMRGFPMNLSPGGGLDDGPAGFPYFADGKFEFGYAGPPFHPHDVPYFGHAPGGGGPFVPAGVVPMDHGGGAHGGPLGAPDFGAGPADVGMFGPPDGPPTSAAGGGGVPGAGGAGSGPPSVVNAGGPNGGGGPQQQRGPTGSPPEFMGGAAFADSAQQLNEGLVW